MAANFRNVLVFLPVALTWEAVSKATEAFAKFVEANNATTVNFLEFWQNGYDVLPAFWTISHIASLDFMIILGVIALSLISTFLNSKGSAINKIELAKIEEGRLDIALSLKMYLYAMREIDNSNVKEGVASSVSALLVATTSLSKSARQLNSVVSELQAGVPVINDFGTRMGKESEKLVAQVGNLTDALSGINSSVTGDLRDAVESATFGLELANQELNNSTHSIRANSRAAETEIKSLQSLIKKASRGK
jgi:chaperonin cofactor prefoldin